MFKNSSEKERQRQAGLVSYKLYQAQQQEPDINQAEGSTPDYLLPFDTQLASAKEGNVSAQFLVGIALFSGSQGQIKDKKEGERWLQLARQNPVNSPAKLCAEGACNERAIGGITIKNVQRAKECFSAALSQGYTPAMYAMSSILIEESSVTSTSTVNHHTVVHHHKDQEILSRGLSLLASAAEAKYPPAYEYLASCYLNGYGVKEDPTEAVRLLQLSIDTGKSSGFGKAHLGDCYKNGWGELTKSKAEAKKLYREAQDQGYDIGDRLNASCCTIN